MLSMGAIGHIKIHVRCVKLHSMQLYVNILTAFSEQYMVVFTVIKGEQIF